MTTSHFNDVINKAAKESNHAESGFKPIPTVPGRTIQIDADFLAYQVSYDDEKSIAEMRSNCDAIVEKFRLMSGAERVALHLTPKGSNKGNRYEIALLKEYQANRAGKVKPKFLNVIREWMHKERDAILHMNCEADDGMAMAQYKAIADGTPELSIIASKDKDLCIVPGLQIDWSTGTISDTTDPFGYIDLHVMDNKAKTKKVKGRGWKFFWAQLLMGDSADNISGLPKVCLPKYLAASGKPKAVGPVLAHEIISPLKSNAECFSVVSNLFRSYGDNVGFVNWRDGSKVSYGDALISEAQLLWMRREHSSTDVIEWMKEHCL